MERKILVIDDELFLRELVSEYFRSSGEIVDTYESGSTALERLKLHSYHIAFVDLMMPEYDGIRLLKEMACYAPDLPVVLITGYADVATIVRAIRKGAFDVLTKPFRLEELGHAADRAYAEHLQRCENHILKEKISVLEMQMSALHREHALSLSGVPARRVKVIRSKETSLIPVEYDETEALNRKKKAVSSILSRHLHDDDVRDLDEPFNLSSGNLESVE